MSCFCSITHSNILNRYQYMFNIAEMRVCKYVCQSVITFTPKQRSLQLQNLVQRYQRGVFRKPRSDFFKNLSRFFKVYDYLKKILGFFYKLFVQLPVTFEQMLQIYMSAYICIVVKTSFSLRYHC